METLLAMSGATIRVLLDDVLARVGALLHRHHGADAMLARTWTTGGMTLWVAILLAAYLLLYYS